MVQKVTRLSCFHGWERGHYKICKKTVVIVQERGKNTKLCCVEIVADQQRTIKEPKVTSLVDLKTMSTRSIQMRFQNTEGKD